MKNKTPLRRAHHEGSVRRRPDGRWEVRFTIPASDGEKARRKSYYCHTKQEAVQILRGQWDPQWNLGPNGTTLLTVGVLQIKVNRFLEKIAKKYSADSRVKMCTANRTPSKIGGSQVT